MVFLQFGAGGEIDVVHFGVFVTNGNNETADERTNKSTKDGWKEEDFVKKKKEHNLHHLWIERTQNQNVWNMVVVKERRNHPY